MSTTTATVEQGIQAAGVGRFQYRLFAIFGLVWMADAMQVLSIGFSAPSIASTFGVPLPQALQTGTWFFVGMLVGAFAFGRLADRIGRRPVLMAAVVVPINLFAFKVGWPLVLIAGAVMMWRRERSPWPWALLAVAMIAPARRSASITSAVAGARVSSGWPFSIIRSKFTRSARNPVVDALAMLLAIAAWLAIRALSPDIAV